MRALGRQLGRHNTSALRRWPYLMLLACLVGMGGLWAFDSFAQQVIIDLGAGESANNPNSTTVRVVQLVALTTILTVAPSLLIMVTSFTRIAVVFSILRMALGAGQSPPNMVLVALAMFLTFFIMAPTFEKSWEDGLRPYMDGQITEQVAFERSVVPVQDFMQRHVRDQDLELMMNLSRAQQVETVDQVPLKALIPAFMISELRRAFEMGFLIFLPFVIIDMVVASVLMSMGMMMIPPTMVALPFKLIFFVMVDGWYMIVGSLVQSFSP